MHMAVDGREDRRAVAAAEIHGIAAADGDAAAVHVGLDDIGQDTHAAPVQRMVGQDQHIPAGLCAHGFQRVRKPQLLSITDVFFFAIFGGVQANHPEFFVIKISIAIPACGTAHDCASIIRADNIVQLRHRQHAAILRLAVLQAVVVAQRSQLRDAGERLADIGIDLGKMLPSLGQRGRCAAGRVVAQIARKIDTWQDIRECFHRHAGVLIAVHDVRAGVKLVRVRGRDKDDAFARAHGLHLFGHLQRRRLDVVRDIRMDDIVLAGYGADRCGHFADFVGGRAAVFRADGSGDGLHGRLFVELLRHQ